MDAKEIIRCWVVCCVLLWVPSGAFAQTPHYFEVELHEDDGFENFNRKVLVAGVPIYAAPGVPERKLQHAANVMAQYLDNDEDGQIDNQRVLNSMLERRACLVMWEHESELEDVELPDGVVAQDLGSDETNPMWHRRGKVGRFDASLEEVWHLITHAGYSKVYPKAFSEIPGSQLANAMDIARGGRFYEVPDEYPEGAWYSYEDETCNYQCMVAEYFYWTMTTMLGAQEGRANEIEDEWRLHTRKLLRVQDRRVFRLLTNPKYGLPKVLPDGVYRGV